MITAAEIQTIRYNDPDAVLPGIDTMTGNPYATSSLLDVTKITQNSKAPYYYSPTANYVYVNQAGAVLSGINFGDATVIIQANNVTIKDCTFADTSSFWAVRQNPTVSGATVENCTFIGSKSPTENNVWITSNLAITIKDNTFLNSPTDAITMRQGVVDGNYFSGEGYAPGAHADTIFVTASTGPTTITNNLIDTTLNANAPGGSSSAIRITNEFGDADNVTVSGNYLLGSGYTIYVSAASTPYTFSNISVTNNDIGFGLYGPYYPGTDTLATVTGNTIVDFSNPAASNVAQAAYKPPGAPTTTVMGNGVAGAHLSASTGETNFVGGFGNQYLFGGLAANILHLSRHWRRRRPGNLFRSSEGRDRSQPHRRRHHHGRRPEFHLHRLRPIQRRRSGALSAQSDEQHHPRPGFPGG